MSGAVRIAVKNYYAPPKQVRHYHSPDDFSWDDWHLSDKEVQKMDLQNAA